MELTAAGLHEQPFPGNGKALMWVPYAAQQAALDALREAHAANHGLCFLQGPTLSGKSTVLGQYLETLDDAGAVARVDAAGLSTARLLEAMLQEYGYELKHGSITELLGMLRVFAMQQTASRQPPLLIVENTHTLAPRSLQALGELAAIKVRQQSALKMILVSDHSLTPLIEAPALEPIRKRLSHDFHLQPMTETECREYLYLKLLKAGSHLPEFLFPAPVCDELWRASGGWPGILDRLALLALAKAQSLPVTADLIEKPALPRSSGSQQPGVMENGQDDSPDMAPRLYVSLNGTTIQEMCLGKSRLLIGRSDHNDISLDSKFVSRHHALLIHNRNSTFLMDLNSTNGVFVNSQRVTSQFLVDGDIILIGHHRMKFVDPTTQKRAALNGQTLDDTAAMQTLHGMRELLARDATDATLPRPENLPTSGV